MAEYHQHEAECWARYEPCGEHHAHSHSCGSGELGPECPEYVPPLQKSKVEPQHDKLGREWFADWHRYHRRYEWRHRDSLPQRAYAQGCADQENRTKAELLAQVADVAEAAGAAGNSPDLLAFAASLRDGSWETPITEASHPSTMENGT